jgi:hypothetical protein
MADEVYFLAPISTLLPSGLEAYLPLDPGTIAAIDSKVAYTEANLIVEESGLGFEAMLVITGELSLELPWLAGTALVIGGGAGAGRTSFTVAAFVNDDGFAFSIDDVEIALRLPPDLLKPAPPEDPEQEPPTHAEISVTGGISVDQGLNLRVKGFDRISLSPVMIGDTGIIISAEDVRLDLSPTETIPEVLAAGFDESFVGVFIGEARVELPEGLPALAPEDLVLRNSAIGTGGVSGWLSAEYSPVFNPEAKRYTGRGASELFSIPFALFNADIQFKQNAFVESKIVGKLLLPFFDEYCDVNISLNSDGSLSARLSAADGLFNFVKPNLFSMRLESIAFELRDGVFLTKVAGQITPLVGSDQGLEWPSFRVDELSIDSKGNIRLEGGWLNLREKYTVNFHGFQLEISKLGFGNSEDGGKWIGFTGGVRLVAGMPAGASVEGLRVTWYEDGRPVQITLNGVRVDFEVPKVMKFAGAVSFHSNPPQFRGAIKLDLIALKMQVDANAVFGIHEGKTYLALYLTAEFPAGIPLFATGLGVYGMAGLFALNMEPNRTAGQEWYAIGSQDDWYHKSPLGVTSLEKWTARTGSIAFGAGVTLGTIADNGHTFSGRVLLAILLPGPIIFLQGSASLLQERATLHGNDSNIRAFGVLDGRAGTLIVGLDAQYRYDESGALIDIRGAAQGYFNFNDPTAWRLNVGENEPRNRRLTARLFNLFESYAYVMLNAQQLAMGAWIGFKQQWQFGPLGVAVEAWIDGNARVSWKPAHFYGDLTLHGSARLSVFGFTAGLTVHAGIKADVFDPFHVVGNFSVAIDLPWPFPDFSVSITLEWGPIPTPPPIPLPLKEVAVEHFKSTVSWPIPRIPRSGSVPLLLPNYDNGEGFLKPLPKPPAPLPPIVPDNLNQLPVVPMDSRPHITFGRNIHDEALVGVNAQPVIPQWEQIGDPVTKQGPARIKYSLEEVVLEKLTNPTQPKNENSWSAVARKGKTPNQPGVPTLYGSWAPMPQMPGGGGQNVGQVKLWLWSKTPFEYTRRSSRAWDEWFNDRFSDYPCNTLPDICWNFEQIEPGRGLSNPWQHPDEEQPLRITSSRTDGISVINLNEPVQGSTRSLSVTLPAKINIDLPEPADIVRIRALEHGSGPDSFSGHDADGHSFPVEIVTEPDGFYFEISGRDMIGIDIDFKSPSLPGKGLASGLAGAIGCDYIPSRNHLVFVEFNSGKLSFIDLNTGKYVVLGTGYTKPEDIVVTADGNTAFITERVGTLLRVELTPGRADRSKAVVLAERQVEPQQIFLDEAKDDVYVVEFVQSGGTGKVLRRDMGAPVHAVVVADKLDQAVGLLVDPERNIIYVSEQSNGGRILRIDLTTGSRETVIGNLPSLFFMRWADAERTKILVPQRDPHNRVHLIDLATGKAEVFIDGVAHRPSSVALLPEELVAICSDQVIHACRTAYCLLSICDMRGAMLIRNTNEELVRWSQSGEVLEPYTHYRLKIKTFVSLRGEKELAGYSQDEPVTEYAYFRTDGPPGVAALTAPIGSEAIPSGQFASGLEDLTRYVRRTVPRVPAPTPDSPLPSRPFYRAYDIGVEFDENYVELMYRLGRRDLTLQFFGGNGPALNDQGLRLLLANPWGRAEQVTLTEREERWLSVLTDTGCALVDPSVITKNTTLAASAEPHVFPPSSLCEVRLIPALLHEDFGGYGPDTGASGPAGSFGRWLVQDDAGSLASRWEIGEEGSPPDLVLTQKNNAATKLVWSDALDLPTSEQPGNWTDYRFSTFLRSGEGTIGVVFRYKDPTQHYRFVMDRENGTRKLIRFPGGDSPALKEESFTYEANRNYLITVEAIGPSLRVCLDGNLVFAVNDPALSAGRVGLYCAATQTARFTDVRVDDLRVSARVVYRFNFLTSRFKNFSDHLSSFAGRAWRAEESPTANIAPLIAAAVPPADPLSDGETRSYDSLISHLPSTVTAQPRSAVQVTRIEQSGQAIAFFVQSPEPFDWKRINLQVLRADLASPVDARVLRKADGAGFFVVVPASNPPGSFLPPALYRFTLTYRRNNRSINSDSEIFSEAGNSAAEQATLDIPWQTL